MLESRGPDGEALDCPACAEAQARGRALAAGLASLPRLSAPRELEGLVTVALGAEVRERRALEALLALERRDTPALLDGRVVAATQAGFREVRAAAVLEDLTRRPVPRRLEVELAARHGAVVEPAPLFSAPEELSVRVDRDLRRLAAGGGPAGRRAVQQHSALVGELSAPRTGPRLGASRRRSTVPLLGSLAAAALLLATLSTWLGGGTSDPASSVGENAHLASLDVSQYSFRVRYVKSADELSPLARAWFEDLQGPLVSGSSAPTFAVPGAGQAPADAASEGL